MKFSYLCLAVIIAFIATTAVADQAHLKAKFSQLFTADGQFTPELKADVCTSFPEKIDKFKGADWVGTDPSDPSHYKYTLTFCDVAKEAECGAKNGALCQYDESLSGVFVNSLASFTASPAPAFAYIDPKDNAKGYQLTFTNGDSCWSGFSSKDRTVVLKFTCDSTKSERKFNIMEPEPCNYEIDIASKFACAGGSGGEGLSGGAIFLIIVLCVSVVYVLTGCIICVAKFGKPIGIEACPHKAFWCALPGLYIAGIKFTIGKIAGLCGSKTITTSSGEYEEA